MYRAARQAFGDEVKLVGGAGTSFTELNRRVPTFSDGLDFLTHSTSAIVHDAGDIPVMQTLEALPYVTATAREMARRGGARGYIINPAAIGIRHQPFGERPNLCDVRMPMANADPRGRGLFGAAYRLRHIIIRIRALG
jgi:hypothetical protein